MTNQPSKKTALLFIPLLFFILHTPSYAATPTVCASGCKFTTIQAAIDSAPSTPILVAPGTYTENLTFNGAPVTVKSVSGPKVTIIDGGGKDCVVFFNNSSKLFGFTVKNGKKTDFGGGFGGGINSCGTNGNVVSPVVKNCIITENYAGVGGGGILVDNQSKLSLINCVISSNKSGGTSGYGGGMLIQNQGTSPTITHCIFRNNSTPDQGGAIACKNFASVTIDNSYIIHNKITTKDLPTSVYGNGAALWLQDADATLTNCVVANNLAESGAAGLYVLSSKTIPPTLTVKNCTIAYNRSFTKRQGAGVAVKGSSQANISNSIIYGNNPHNVRTDTGTGYINISDSCLDEWNDIYPIDNKHDFVLRLTAANVIKANPQFIRGNHYLQGNSPDYSNYHLQSGSPCIDTASSSGAPAKDLEGNARPIGGGVDMGAFEYNRVSGAPFITDMNLKLNTATKIGVTLEAEGSPTEMAVSRYPAFRTPKWVPYKSSFNTPIPANTNAIVRIYVKTRNSSGESGIRAAQIIVGYPPADVCLSNCKYNTIQRALDEAPSSYVFIDDGTYYENVDCWTKLIIKSLRGPEKTIINGQGQDNTFVFWHNAELDGVTLANGNGSTLYGVGGGMIISGVSPTVKNCIIRDNYTTGAGGGLMVDKYSTSVIMDTVIRNNHTGGWGGGVSVSNHANPIFIRCTIEGNSTDKQGGGMYLNAYSQMSLYKCSILNNTANDGGGIEFHPTSTASNLVNCVIAKNRATGGNMAGAGGLYYMGSYNHTITNCTIAGNIAPDSLSGITAGGIYVKNNSIDMVNSIVWGNYPSQITHSVGGLNGSITAAFSDIQDDCALRLGGCYIDQGGNFSEDPLFVGSDDYHLTKESPCIDVASDDQSAYPTIPNDDFDDDFRPQDGNEDGRAVRDVGADEYAPQNPPQPPPPPACIPQPETCDYVDNDCDGEVDEDCLY